MRVATRLRQQHEARRGEAVQQHWTPRERGSGVNDGLQNPIAARWQRFHDEAKLSHGLLARLVQQHGVPPLLPTPMVSMGKTMGITAAGLLDSGSPKVRVGETATLTRSSVPQQQYLQFYSLVLRRDSSLVRLQDDGVHETASGGTFSLAKQQGGGMVGNKLRQGTILIGNFQQTFQGYALVKLGKVAISCNSNKAGSPTSDGGWQQ